jgi:tRNA pseudouridine38-40 synthase
MQNYKLIISYDGTDYYGWQRQPNKKTIQGQLESALEKILSKKTAVIGSGRTDAGVHALGQTAHFKADTRLDKKEFFEALNGRLPKDIRIVSLQKIPSDFHARKSALSKIYQYRIINSTKISPFLLRYTLQWPAPLNLKSIKEAASLFIREGDFTSFSSNRLLYPVRKVISSEIEKKGDEIIYTVEANGFLRYMVRSIVGTLLEVGRGKMKPQEIEILFERKKRTASSPTAPAKGLCLLEVRYPE